MNIFNNNFNFTMILVLDLMLLSALFDHLAEIRFIIVVNYLMIGILFFHYLPHQFKLVAFHWNLSDSKSSWVSRTLLSIQANLNNALVWMGLMDSLSPICPVNFMSSWRPFQAHQLWLVSLSLSWLTDFFAQRQNLSICLFFCFLSFSLCDLLE